MLESLIPFFRYNYGIVHDFYNNDKIKNFNIFKQNNLPNNRDILRVSLFLYRKNMVYY